MDYNTIIIPKPNTKETYFEYYMNKKVNPDDIQHVAALAAVEVVISTTTQANQLNK